MNDETAAQMPLPDPADLDPPTANLPLPPRTGDSAAAPPSSESAESAARAVSPQQAPPATPAPAAAASGGGEAGSKDARPWMLCIVDSERPRKLVTEIAPLVARKLRVAICPTVTAGLKHIEMANAVGDKVLAVMSEEPMAGMSGGGLWGLQKCKIQAPEMLRILAVQNAQAVLKLNLDRLRDADVHQVFDVSIPAAHFVQRILQPMLAKPKAVVDETLRSATVRAATDVSLLRIPKETFTQLLDQDPKLSIGITRELARRLRRLQQ